MKPAARSFRFLFGITGICLIICSTHVTGVTQAIAGSAPGNIAGNEWTEMQPHTSHAGISLESDGDGIRVGPNPFTPNNNGFNDFVRFDFSAADAVTGYKVQVFDMNGKRVRSLSSDGQPEIIWDGTDTGGSVLKPGIYLYIIERNNRVVRRGSVTLAL